MSFSCLRTHEYEDCRRINITLKDVLTTHDIAQIQQSLHCSICLQPFHEPITTECGHTFCKECLIRIMTDLQNRACPICRYVLDRIGKICQLLSHWIQAIYQQKSTSIISQEYIPIIKLNTAVTFPTQHCLFHINQHNNQSLFKQMIQNPYQHHYALCLFYSNEDEHYYDYGVMVKINHVEHSSDIQHSVIQAYGLFRLRIHQILQDSDNTYISYVTRLEDSHHSSIMHPSSSSPLRISPTTTTTTIHIPSKPMSMARPSMLKHSNSLPNNSHHETNIMHQYHHRKTWTSPMQFTHYYMKQPSPFDLTTTATKCEPSPPPIDDVKLKNELDQRVQLYLQQKPELLMKYECYNEQEVEYIWWLCTILPFQQPDKIYLLSLLSLRARILSLIDYMDTKLISIDTK